MLVLQDFSLTNQLVVAFRNSSLLVRCQINIWYRVIITNLYRFDPCFLCDCKIAGAIYKPEKCVKVIYSASCNDSVGVDYSSDGRNHLLRALTCNIT